VLQAWRNICSASRAWLSGWRLEHLLSFCGKRVSLGDVGLGCDCGISTGWLALVFDHAIWLGFHS
jgi:hypothetical protein